MKKKTVLFLLLAMLMLAGTSRAQSTLMATLNHEGTMTVFYGTTALTDAHKAAVHGDVITLSAGRFSGCDITKAVTVRGAGTDANNPSVGQTLLYSDFSIQISDDAADKKFVMEGICHDGAITLRGNFNNPTFMKCRLNKIGVAQIGYPNPNYTIKDLTFIQCRILDSASLASSEVSGVFINSYVRLLSYGRNIITNCVIGCKPNIDANANVLQGIASSVITNSILIAQAAHKIHYSNTIYNCISNLSVFADGEGYITNTKVSEGIFKTWDLKKVDYNTSFELTDEAAAKYLGDDGTQVGMYGGPYPYDPTPSNPRITKCNVASESTADGKLSVEIEVNGDK